MSVQVTNRTEAASPTAEKSAEQARLETLMERYQQADATATAELVRLVSPMLLRFLAGPLQTRALAEDMLQECWLRVHKARHTYRQGAPVLPWIFAIARYTRVDAYRRRSRIDRREHQSEDLEAVARADAEPGPANSDNIDLWRLVAQLPRSQQEVVKMLKVTGMSLEEVARATGGSVGSVKQKAHRAYTKLRELLESEGFRGGGKAAR